MESNEGCEIKKGGINGVRNTDQREGSYRARDEDDIEMMMTCMLKMEQTHVRGGKKRCERQRGQMLETKRTEVTDTKMTQMDVT